MCGIAGIFNLNGAPVSGVTLRNMTDALSHRGPEGEGLYSDGPIGLGHRRLKIIDLTPAGHQPMIDINGNYAITYNGEIYNYQELRVELESYGYQFHSNTDTEVVLNAWVHWGEDCIHKFNGMFAFAIWSKQEQSLYLARDRYGIKPLYYQLNEGVLLFASEQKAINKHPNSKNTLDKIAFFEYFTFQNILSDRTFNQSTKLLEPATILKAQFGKQTVEKLRYWDYEFTDPDTAIDEREYHEELTRLIHQAVQRQLVSDVELGSYLSGGMDSGTLTSLASNELPYIKTFTCGFDLSSASGMELTYDERVKAEAMSALFKTEHYEMVLKSGDMERAMHEVVFAIEEPRVGQSYPNYYAAKLASKFVKVVLSGTGGDELFGGYPWRYYRAVNCRSFNEYIDNYYNFWQRLIPGQYIKQIFEPMWPDIADVSMRDIFRSVFKHKSDNIDRPEDAINNSLYFEAKTFLHGLFVIEDKLSMAHSLETRVPFMDNDLVNFAMRCPVSMKLNNLRAVVRINENEPGSKINKYYQKTNDGKKILRTVMEKLIPKAITEATKQGFSSPDASWFKGESIEFVKRALVSDEAKIYKYLDKETVHVLLQQHFMGQENRRLLIWSLLFVERYLLNSVNEGHYDVA